MISTPPVLSGLHEPGVPRRWRTWPIPALAAWSLAWVMHGLLGAIGLSAWLGLTVGTGMGLWLSRFGATRMRALAIAAGFPLSLLASDAAGALPAWAWLLPLALLWLLYPRRAWHDAPLFPTPPRALDALPAQILLAPGARVLDAGCGLGHGLRALRRAYPQARLEGVEGSWPLVLGARAACRYATVHHADMWSQSWAAFELVYLFQRPESMPRALAKAAAEMASGGWVASLEFEAAGWAPQALLRCPDGRPLWLYRLPLRPMRLRSAGDACLK